MLNFKLRKGEIATLLTLGLVLVGTLITLGTSLFVNNKKTNLASNSRAACISQPQPCTTVKSTYKIGVYYSSNGKYYKSINCGTELVEGVGTYCKNMNPSTSSPTVPATPTGCINNIPSLSDCKETFNNKPVTYNSVTKKCCLAGNVSSPLVATPTLSPKGCGSGGGYPCDPAQGYNKSSCPKDNLEFACCVKDNSLCGGEPRYRWYGCTGQPCGNTKINNSYGQLFGCPAGVNSSNTSPEQGICEGQLTPTKAPAPTSPSGGDIKLAGENCGYEDDCVTGYTCVVNTGDVKKPHTGGKCITSGGINRTGLLGELCIYRANTYSCVNPGATCSSPNSTGVCVMSGGVKYCTDVDYTVLADNSCGADGWCGPKQRKYKKSVNNTCIPTSQTNSEFKCKNDSSCIGETPTRPIWNNLRCRYVNCFNSSQKYYYYREYTNKFFIDENSCNDINNVGSTKAVVSEQVCGDTNQTGAKCVPYGTVSCNIASRAIYHKQNCNDKNSRCFGTTQDSCNAKYIDTYTQLCGNNAPDTVVVPVPVSNTLQIPTAYINVNEPFILTITSPTEMNCQKVKNNDYSCSNYTLESLMNNKYYLPTADGRCCEATIISTQ